MTGHTGGRPVEGAGEAGRPGGSMTAGWEERLAEMERLDQELLAGLDGDGVSGLLEARGRLLAGFAGMPGGKEEARRLREAQSRGEAILQQWGEQRDRLRRQAQEAHSSQRLLRALHPAPEALWIDRRA